MNVEFFTNLGLIKNTKPYVIHIDGNGEMLFITAINERTGKLISRFPLTNAKMLLEQIPLMFDNKLKGVYSTLCGVRSSNFPNQVEFCKAISNGFAQFQIPVYYYTKKNFIWTMCLVAANVSVEIGENIFILITHSHFLQYISLIFTSNGYKNVCDETIPLHESIPSDSYRQLVLGSSNPSKIIISTSSFDATVPEFVKNAFKSKKTIIVDRQPHIDKSVLITFKWLNEKSNSKFIVLPQCPADSYFGFKYGSADHQLIAAKCGDQLPFTKTIVLPRSSFTFYMAYVDFVTSKTVYTNLLTFKNVAHRRQITFTVNEGNLPSYQVEAKIIDEIKNLPQTLTEKVEVNKIPVIGFFDNSSVICVWDDDKNRYEFLDTWNGMFGNELLIAFDNEKPAYCTDAAATIKSKPSFVVSDLINIMSESNAKPFYPYGFKITKDDENPVLIEFDNYDGTRKVATPVFLMALLLKAHIKVLRKYFGEKPSKVGFCLPLEKDTAKRMRIKNQIAESFLALKVDCVFIKN